MAVQLTEREDTKRMNVAVEQLRSRTVDLRDSLMKFELELQRRPITSWPTVLDHFHVLQGQLSILLRQVSSEKMPVFSDRVFAPTMLSTDKDEHLEAMTQGRIQSFTHEVVPQCLRTKPIPEMETGERELWDRLKSHPVDRPEDIIASMNEACEAIRKKLQAYSKTNDAKNRASAEVRTPSEAASMVAMAKALYTGAGLK